MSHSIIIEAMLIWLFGAILTVACMIGVYYIPMTILQVACGIMGVIFFALSIVLPATWIEDKYKFLKHADSSQRSYLDAGHP
jgi:hypothetical protein